jgi:tetratricopeptide (TPR) repeat protein
MGDLEEAEEQKRLVLEIWVKSLGEDHPYTMAAKNNLAITLARRGEHKQAEILQRQLLGSHIRISGDDDVATAEARQNLGANLLRQGRLDEAEPLIKRAHEGFSHYRPEHYATAFPLLSLSEIYLKRKQYARAEETSQSAMRQFARTLPADHPLYAVALSRHGAALAGLGRLEEARLELATAILTLESAEGFQQDLIAAEEWKAELATL